MLMTSGNCLAEIVLLCLLFDNDSFSLLLLCQTMFFNTSYLLSLAEMLCRVELF